MIGEIERQRDRETERDKEIERKKDRGTKGVIE